MTTKKRIALFGLGEVGLSFWDLARNAPDARFEIVAICVRDRSRGRVVVRRSD